MNFINELFLFVLSIDKNQIINELNFLELDERYFNKNVPKGKNKENNKDLLILMMRHNFGKFWNIINYVDKYNFIKIFLSTVDIDIIGVENNNVSIIYDTLEKIIKYSDNVNLIEHIMNFYDVDRTNAIIMLESTEINLNNNIDKNVFKYFDKNEIINFRHNICMFWLGLNNQRKTKIIKLVEVFFSKLNSTQFEILFGTKNQYKDHYIINYFDSCKKNVILIKNYDQLTNMVLKIEESKKSINIDTIIFQDINLSGYDLIKIPSQIKKIKFIKNQIKSIDQIHDGIEVIDCDGNYIENIDNLPTSTKVLICSNNAISSLDNLPEGLEYLDCHTNKINRLNNLPKSLKYLNCNYNKIDSINYLPINLIELDCSKNLLSKLPDLPDNLVKLNIKGNKITDIKDLPFGLKELNISSNQIDKIYSLNGGLEKLITGNTTYFHATIYDLPNMLIGMMGGKLNNKLESIYNQLINSNF